MRNHLTRGTTPTRTTRRWWAAAIATAALTTASLGGVVTPADAGTTVPGLPQTDPRDTTPRVVDDTTVRNAGVYELRQVGAAMYAGGHFRVVRNAAGTRSYTRNNIVAFNANTGAVRAVPRLGADAAVRALEVSPDRRYLWIGGDFGRFGGATVNNLVKFDRRTNRVVARFRFRVPTTRVSDVQLVGNRLFVSGTFPGGIVAVNPNTGLRLPYLNGVQATGTESGYRNNVYRFALNPAGDRMAVIGSFTAVGGEPRQQAALINLRPRTASVSPWTSPTWNADCSRRLHWYTRDVDWAPDGSYFVVVTTGGAFADTFCDAATRWEPVDAPDQEPTWVQYTGGDTFHSVLVTDKAVFVGGHFRWLDNPEGRDNMGPGAARAQGLGALEPDTGLAIRSWNPTKSLEGGLGAYDLYFTGRGLWVGHFEERIGREQHEGLGMLPF